MRTFVSLHFWAFVMDLAVIAMSSVWLSLPIPIYISVFWAILTLFIAAKAVELHMSVERKYRARNVLLEKNRHEFKADSFEQFMHAPCGRMMVRDVLRELGCSFEYRELKKRYYRGFFFADQSSGLVIIPNPHQELSK